MFIEIEEKALRYAIAALKKEVSYYECLVADLKKQGKDISAVMMEKKMIAYQNDLNALLAVQDRGYFRQN